MPDELDRAQEHEQELRDDALAARFRHVHGELSADELAAIDWRVASALACADCDEPIPVARRQAVPGCTRCVDCQGLTEFRGLA